MLWIGALVVALAAWHFDWSAWLADKSRQHLSFGAAIALVPLWMLQAGIKDGLEFHFLGLTVLALMLGWRLGVMMSTLSLLLLTGFGVAPWSAFGANLLLGVIIPISFTYLVFFTDLQLLISSLICLYFCRGLF